MPMQSSEPFWSFVQSRCLRILRSAVWFISDTILATVMVACIWAFWRVFHTIWGLEDPLLFDWLPLRYLFHAVEGAVIVVYGYDFVRHAIAEFS
jgi:hypothetical protein